MADRDWRSSPDFAWNPETGDCSDVCQYRGVVNLWVPLPNRQMAVIAYRCPNPACPHVVRLKVELPSITEGTADFFAAQARRAAEPPPLPADEVTKSKTIWKAS
ncbi:hypothetical protein JOF53_001281 [Crossiella equi]|uniref:Uncharacterized protein n=1 Tax=Crossiella equi TaxID=130796 RepID=A0ABS5A733_9PSEU|nr:hypothetical protein [Crossiella equi]MBP2472409.1 hypothetical protein [Crossiella equi]